MVGVRGRPRTFDIDSALERALEVFWKHGFQDASLHELTAAMGLSKPSLYAAFGDKEALYLKTLERYIALLLERHAALLDAQGDGRKAVEDFLRSMAAMLADPQMPGGCFIVNGTADCGGSTIPASVETALRDAFRGSETMLLRRLQRAADDGDLPRHLQAQALAAMFWSVIAGMAVLAKSGASLDKLEMVIETAMSVWPSKAAQAS